MAFWITLGRSLFSLALGVAILFWPDKARPMLGNFIGGFWIAGSLMSVRWGLANDRSKLLTILVGVFGTVAGLAMVGRSVVDNYVSPDLLFSFLGVVAVLTGVLHASGHMPVQKFAKQRWTRSGLILGIFEIVLGAVLIFTPWQERTLINYVAIGWAMLGGVILFGDAMAMRREAKQEKQQAVEGSVVESEK